ncbi:hypothetical protein B296_00048706 [Ensete ventricosum]|uniref:Uncharacterized protein n=1 Tax=Ensete ventricosum TaxID=4639 RepID=A0A426WVQ5_ENSVE|nr:hypothetical protein B296_00048706 [Ensete ventricosum]
MSSVVLAARHAPAVEGCRPCPPYLDFAERVNSDTNPGDLAEKVNSGTSPGDLAERVNSGTNPGDLTEKVNSGTNPGDLAEMFSLHPLIEECLRWWRISPSQVAPNSWRYLVVFLGECRGAGIIPIRDLFMACFRLFKSRGDYHLTARVGFRVSGAPSDNKGWKSRYLFVSGLVWGLGLIGRHTRSAMPPRTYPRRNSSWSVN